MNDKNLPAPPTQYRDLITKLASDEKFDVDKLERLLALQQEEDDRYWNAHFNEMFARVQSEMAPISRDATNDQTRSQYATFAQLDSKLKPIYSKYGFGVTTNTEAGAPPEHVRVVGFLTNGPISRKYEYDSPYSTTGFKGTAMMTMAHAKQSAVTYGRRTILTMMFNIATEDDDGNAATPKRPQQPKPLPQRQAAPPNNDQILEPQFLERKRNETNEQEPWQEWGQRFIAIINKAANGGDIDSWVRQNMDIIDVLKNENVTQYSHVQAAVQKARNKLKLVE